jgi:hypothetical protein
LYAIPLLVVSANLGAVEPETALSRLENWNDEFGLKDLHDSVRAIRSGIARGDSEASHRLRGIVKNDNLPNRIRLEALRLACEKSNQQEYDNMLGLLLVWAHELAGNSVTDADKINNRSVGAKSLLVSSFVNEMLEGLIEEFAQTETIFQFLRIVSGRTWCGLDAKNSVRTMLLRATDKSHIETSVLNDIWK